MGRIRKIVMGGCYCVLMAGWSIAFAAENPSGSKDIQIFVDGKNYGSLSEYRRSQVERLRQGYPSGRKKAISALEIGKIKPILEALLRAQSTLTLPLFTQKDLKRMIKNALAVSDVSSLPVSQAVPLRFLKDAHTKDYPMAADPTN